MEHLEIVLKVVEFDLQIHYEQIEAENVLEKEEFEQNTEIGEVFVVRWERRRVSVELWGKWKKIDLKDKTRKKAVTGEIVKEWKCQAIRINFSQKNSVKPSDHLLRFYL